MQESRKLDLQEFVDEIYEDYKKNEDTEYIFFLGAGCSKSSGIPLAKELAKQWFEELKSQKTKFDKFIEKHKLKKIKEETFNFGEKYFEIFEELFPTPLMQQKEIQRITNDESVNPSLGYYVLASLMQKPPFNTIITTNFDNLIQDALIYSGNKRALVITHQDLAQFIKRDNTPLITKIHGDAHMRPFNNIDETKKVPEPLKGAIQSLFTNVKVICMGYGGNDESIKDLLEGCSRIDQVYWLNASEPKDVKLTDWWDNLRVKTFIEEYDFDKIMNLIKSKFDIESPDFNKIAQKLKDSYDCALDEEIKDLERMEQKTFVDYYLLGKNYQNSKDYMSAIKSLEKAIELKPNDENTYIDLGNIYIDLKEYDKSIKSYESALAVNPNDYISYYNLGISYSKKEEFDMAIKFYKKAIETNPVYDKSYTNLFEVELITEKLFDKELEEKYIKSFKNNKNVFIKYDLLKFLFNINQNKEVDLDKWEEDYKEQNLKDWSFDELEKWINKKESPKKEKLLEAIELFKTKVA